MALDRIDVIRHGAFAWLNSHSSDLNEELKMQADLPPPERLSFISNLLSDAGFLKKLGQNSSKDPKKSIQRRNAGNILFKRKDDAKAVLAYTQALFFAPEGSREYYLALSNRAAAFLNLKKYRQALEDAEAALSLAEKDPKVFPEYLKKTREKIAKCQTAPSTDSSKGPSPDDEVCLSYLSVKDDRNPNIPCASNAVRLDRDDDCGRKLVACEDLEPGRVIAAERPYCQFLIISDRFERCANCLSPDGCLRPCPDCVHVGFCSDVCRSEARWHAYECPIIEKLIFLEFTKIELLSLRVVTKVRSENPNFEDLRDTCSREDSKKKDVDVTIDSTYPSVHRLDTNECLRDPRDIFQKGITLAIFLHLLKTDTDFFEGWNSPEAEDLTASLLVRHSMTVPTNMHTISEVCRDGAVGYSASSNFGSGAYSFMSMANHSCCPNVTLTDIGLTKVMTVLRPIKKGEQIFDNYGAHHAMMTKTDRQRRLYNQYWFCCECQACRESWPMFCEMPVRESKYDILFNEKNHRLLLAGNVHAATEFIESLYKAADELEKKGPCWELLTNQEYIKQCLSLFALNINKKNVIS